jgi:hypothetical protein
VAGNYFEHPMRFLGKASRIFEISAYVLEDLTILNIYQIIQALQRLFNILDLFSFQYLIVCPMKMPLLPLFYSPRLSDFSIYLNIPNKCG